MGPVPDSTIGADLPAVASQIGRFPGWVRNELKWQRVGDLCLDPEAHAAVSRTSSVRVNIGCQTTVVNYVVSIVCF